MTSEPATFPEHRFPAEIISHAVWLYHVFGLSFLDVELLLADQDITVTYKSIRQWCFKFGADFARTLRRRRPKPGDTRLDWFNNRRLLEPIGNIPPAEAEARYYASQQEIALAA